MSGAGELTQVREHGPGPTARNARTRYAGWRPASAGPATDPDVEIRDLDLYGRLAGLGVVS